MGSWKKTAAQEIWRAADKLRPALRRMLPRGAWRYVKNHFMRWAAQPGNEQRKPYEAGAYPAGVNLYGYLRAETGLGQGARLTARALETAGIPCRLLNLQAGVRALQQEEGLEDALETEPLYSVNLLHVNADQTELLHLMRPRADWDRRYNIGIWLWELEEFPEEWCRAFALVDEVWAPSRFVARAIEKKSPVPVRVMPYGIIAAPDSTVGRAQLGLPEEMFLYLCMYDVNSTMQRKNPLGAVRAFKEAFGKEERGVGLVVKVNNSGAEDTAVLEKELEGWPNIFLIERTLPKAQVDALIAACDAFVSLHRSEGFGLVLAEAMLLGRPVIGTGWSSVTDFMTAENSCPVGYTLKPLEAEYYLSKKGQRWAEPDIGQAAGYMRRLYEDRDYYAQIAENGQRDIREKFSPEQAGGRIRERLEELSLLPGSAEMKGGDGDEDTGS